jgi:uncharacterized membrane protein
LLSRRFWIQIRLVGWIIILVWYIVYTVDAISPILNNQFIAVSHGVTGMFGTVLVLLGYYKISKKRLEHESKEKS